MSLLATLALLAQLVPPAGAPPPAVERARPVATPAWEVPLPAAVVITPRVLEIGEHALVLVPLADALEVRRAADGALVWRRAGLGGEGLSIEDLVATTEGPAIGWAGISAAGGPPTLVVLHAETGRTLFETELPLPPSGPPTPVLVAADRPVWFVPLGEQRVEVVDPAGIRTGWFDLGATVWPPLIGLFNQALAVVGDQREVVGVGVPRDKPIARDIDPRTERYFDGRMFAAGERSFVAWHCRDRGGTVRCHEDWRQPLGGAATSPPLVLPDRVIVTSWDTHIYAFVLRNGHLLWRAKVGLRLVAPPIRFGDRLAVFPEGTSQVRFFRSADGSAAGMIEGRENETHPVGGTGTGNLLVVPVFTSPQGTTSLRALRLSFEAPRRPAS